MQCVSVTMPADGAMCVARASLTMQAPTVHHDCVALSSHPQVPSLHSADVHHCAIAAHSPNLQSHYLDPRSSLGGQLAPRSQCS